jgi:hypothetical protein
VQVDNCIEAVEPEPAAEEDVAACAEEVDVELVANHNLGYHSYYKRLRLPHLEPG